VIVRFYIYIYICMYIYIKRGVTTIETKSLQSWKFATHINQMHFRHFRTHTEKTEQKTLAGKEKRPWSFYPKDSWLQEISWPPLSLGSLAHRLQLLQSFVDVSVWASDKFESFALSILFYMPPGLMMNGPTSKFNYFGGSWHRLGFSWPQPTRKPELINDDELGRHEI